MTSSEWLAPHDDTGVTLFLDRLDDLRSRVSLRARQYDVQQAAAIARKFLLDQMIDQVNRGPKLRLRFEVGGVSLGFASDQMSISMNGLMLDPVALEGAVGGVEGWRSMWVGDSQPPSRERTANPRHPSTG